MWRRVGKGGTVERERERKIEREREREIERFIRN